MLPTLRREVVQRLDAIVAFSGLEAFLDEPIRTYSSGMVARLGFSVAAHLDLDILLIDEILAVGDANFKAKCHERLTDFRRQGVTLVTRNRGSSSTLRPSCLARGGKDSHGGGSWRVLEAYRKS